MKPSILPACCLLLFTAVAALAQPIRGRITDAQTHKALPFVNIGVVGKTLGTVADERGAYQLAFEDNLADEAVRVSSLGYAPRTLTLRELAAQPDVALAPAAVALADVQVRGQSALRRTHTLGNTGNSDMATCTLGNSDLGGEVGTVVRLRRRPTRVLSAHFNIARPSPGQVTFRVNLYRLDAHGRPTDVKLLPRDVIVTAPIVKGPITVDLTADQLVLNEDFFLSLEMLRWADAAAHGAEFAFSAAIGYAGNEIYTRKTSQAAWERESAGALLAGMQPKLSFYVIAND